MIAFLLEARAIRCLPPAPRREYPDFVSDDASVVMLPGRGSPDGASGEDVVMQVYEARAGSFRGRSVLTKNALSLVMQGHKTMYFAARTVQAGSDEVHLLSAGNCVASMELGGRGPFQSILIYFDTGVHEAFAAKYDALIRSARAHTTALADPYISFRKDAFIHGYISSLHSLLQSGRPLSADMKRLKLEEILLHLLESQPEKFLAFRPQISRDLSDLDVRRAVEVSLTSSLSIDELAFLCKCSPSTFKRRFMRIYGLAPITWIRQRRMELAADLLGRRGTRPSEVFHQIGFETHSSFSQAFKSAFGLTPREYQLRRLSFPRQ